MRNKFLLQLLLLIGGLSAFAQSPSVTHTFNDNGTFIVPCGVTSMTVQCWGGGGGGGGDSSPSTTTAGGGGSGGYSTNVLAVSPGQSITYVVGAGGNGGSSAGTNGAGGGNTTFSSVTAGGGAGGGGCNGGANGIGGGGGTGSTVGGNGFTGVANSSGAGGNAPSGGTGGPSVTVDANGNFGNAPGGGGSGANCVTTGKFGGTGGRGRIVVSYTQPVCTTCGGNFFDSGSNTGSYNNDEYSVYTFGTAANGNKLLFRANTSSTLASGDTLRVYDGNSTAAPLMATLTANFGASSPSFRPSGSFITFAFRSNLATTAAGWDFAISCLPPNIVSVSQPTMTVGNSYSVQISGHNTTFSINSPGRQFDLINGTTTVNGTIASVANDSLINVNFTPPCNANTVATYTLQTQGYGQGILNLNNAVTISPLAITATSATICVGQTATVTATGANTYTWSPGGLTTASVGLSPTSTTVYTVTGTNTVTTCSNTATSTVTVNGLPSVSITSTNVSCNGLNDGSATANVTGGGAPYSYLWTTAPAQSTITATNMASGNYTVNVSDINGCAGSASVTITQPSALLQSLNPVSSTCGNSNGSITATASGGTPGYQYSLNGGTYGATNNFTGLAAGSYTVAVKDVNLCTTTSTVAVTNIPGPTAVSVSTTNATCGTNNGVISIGAVTGGTPAYTYSVSTLSAGFTTTTNYSAVAPGSYTVTVKDANGCTYMSIHTVGNTPGPNALTVNSTNATCGGANGSITIGATTGGTPAYTYSFNGGAYSATTSYTGLSASTYTIAVRDANMCVFTTTKVVSNIPGPTAMVLTPTNATCGSSNGSFTIGTITGGTPAYTYSVAPGPAGFNATTNYINLAAGAYTVTVKDANACTYTATIAVGNTAGPTAMVLTPTNETCGMSNGSVTIGAITGGTPSYTYSFDGSAFTATTVYAGLVAGTHTAVVKDANSCTYTTTIAVGNTAGPTAMILTPTNETCGMSNGSIAIGAITGGTPAYTYSLNGSAFTATTTYTGLVAANHTVTVKDANGCTFTSNSSVGNTAGPTAMVLTPTSAACGASNGSVTIGAITGGTPAYTYSFNGSAFTATTTYTGLAAGTHTAIVKDANACTYTTTVIVGNTSGPSNISVSTTNATCGNANGSISVDAVVGGAAPYQYSLNGGAFGSNNIFTGLTAGIYTVAVQDVNNCFYSQAIPVANQAGPMVSITVTNVSCFGGSNGTATANVSGGTAPYNFVWSPSGGSSATATGLSAGIYTVTVTDVNSCVANATAAITEPTALMVNTIKTDVSCAGANNGTASANASGGVGPYSYSWLPGGQTSPSIINLVPGQYTVTVTDNNLCVSTKTITITEPMPLTATASKTNVSCFAGNNGTATVTASGGTAPYQYIWNPYGGNSAAAYGLAAGTYTCGVRDAHNCTTSTTITITQPTAMNLNVSVTNASCGNNNGSATANVTGGVSPYVYQWSSGSQVAVADSLLPGQYIVQVYDANGCNRSAMANINSSNGPVIALVSLNDITCNGSNNGSIAVSVSGGAMPYTYAWSTGANTSSISGLSAAPYDVTVTDANNCSAVQTYTVSEPSALTFDFVTTPASCGTNDGSIVATVSGGTGSYTYLWSTNAGSQTTATASNLSAGIYTLTVVDAQNCTSNGVTTVSSAGGSITVVVDTTTAAGCGTSSSGSISITASGGTAPYSFAWSNGSSAEDQVGLNPGTYYVTASDVSGCVGTASAIIESALAGYQPQICVVTVDSTTLTNKVVWEKTILSGIKSFKIYREAGTNIYVNVATVPFDSLSEYSDPVANPAVRSWRYKISAVDSCDIETPLSSPHKTIHLVQFAALGGANSLIWDFYDGYAYDYFFIWRDDPSTGWMKIDSMPSNLTSYTDLAPPSVDSRYMIEIIPPNGCNSTRGAINTSRSNIKSPTSVVGIKSESSKSVGFNVYPNPATEMLNIELKIVNNEPAIITMENTLGQVIYSTQTNKSINTVNLKQIETGVYLLKVKTASGVGMRKVVVE